MNVDELFNMTDEEKQAYLEAEVEKLVAKSNNPEKLRGLQWKCDAIRQKNGDKHMKSTIEMSKMMWDSVLEQQKAVNGLQEEVKQHKLLNIVEINSDETEK